ncbi:MAG: rhomboid family intramembrane serine protease [Gemmatimonadetes bacterium]|nr:rhomboid family intramembrane serine protease [Gemmatimonadota bacterium]
MNDAERSSGTTSAPADHRPRAVRVALALSFALYFVQTTVLAPGDVESTLGFSSNDLGRKWWTLATFTLVHSGMWPLVLNLAVLGVFGSYLERIWGTGEFIRYYAICSLGAWIAHLTFVSSDITLAGAAAPAIGMLLAFAAMNGGAQHFRVGAVSLSSGTLAALGTIAILIAGAATASGDGSAAYLVHGAGLFAGWAYLRTTSSINLVRLREGVSPVPDETDDIPPRAVPRNHHPRAQRHDEDDIVARSNAAVALESAARTMPPPREPVNLNQVLDKISEQGIESLTNDERRLLDEVSRRLRDI